MTVVHRSRGAVLLPVDRYGKIDILPVFAAGCCNADDLAFCVDERAAAAAMRYCRVNLYVAHGESLNRRDAFEMMP